VTHLAAASSALRPVLAGPGRRAEFLGVTRGALYLKIPEPPGVLALLSHDAVRLPCGFVLPVTSAELPLASLTPPSSAGYVVGDNAVCWTGPTGPVVVRAVREWAPARPAHGELNTGALAAVRSALRLVDSGQHLDRCEFSITAAIENSQPWRADRELLADAAAFRLLGRGPGLTPCGDDVLAGYLVGAAVFGLDTAALRHTIAVLAPARTMALSAALLWHADRGECIAELAAVAAVLTGRSERQGPEQLRRAVGRLLAVGHSSGAALALGLVTAAESARDRREWRVA
jgi:Protein of unknown function (DUF2877)